MSSASQAAPTRSHWLRWGIVVFIVCLAGYTAVVALRVVRESREDDTRPADAIVVFGAAEYSGHPSPVFRARLDHALELYDKRLAPIIIVTGGAGGDPRYSEGGVGRAYLVEHGVPENAIIAETQGDNTNESAERVAVIMHVNNMKTCDAVSDDTHMFRLKRMLEREGIVVYGAPRPELRPESASRRVVTVMREATSYVLWKLHIT